MSFSEGSSILIIFNIILLIILFFRSRRVIKYHNGKTKYNRAVYIALIFIFCLFSFWGGDWFHYQYGFKNVYEITHMESVYIWLLKHSTTYLLFRTIVWGGSLLLLLCTFKRVKIDFDVALALFSMVSLLWFSYARVTLSFALMFFGLALISDRRSSILVKLLGVVFLWVSVYFHKSAPFGIAMILFSLIVSVVRTKAMPFLMILFVVIASLSYSFNFGGFLESLTYVDNETLSGYASAGGYYVDNGEGRSFSLNNAANLLKLIEMLVYVLEAVLSLMLVVRLKTSEIPFNIRCFAMVVLLIFMTSTFIGVISNEFMGVVHTRLLRFCIIPSVIVYTYTYQNGYFRKFCIYVFYFCCFSTFAHVLYSLYCTL